MDFILKYNRQKVFLAIGSLILLVFLLSIPAGCGSKQQPGAQTTETGSTAAAEKQIVLKFADAQPLSNPTSIHGAQFFIKRVAELSNGKVKIQHYPAEQLGKAKDLLDLLKGGTTDIAYIGPSWMAGKLPLSSVGELPGLWSDTQVASKAYWKICQGILYEKEFKKYGIIPLGAGFLGAYQVLTTKKPVKSLDDLKGMKIRVAGGPAEDAALAVGAVPVSLPAPEAYEALQRGVLDGIFITHSAASGYKLQELCKYGTVGADFASFTIVYCINEGVWNKLPDDAKKVLKQAGEDTVVNLPKGLDNDEVKLIEKWEKEKIMTMYRLSPAEQQEWSKRLEPVQNKWIEDYGEKRFTCPSGTGGI